MHGGILIKTQIKLIYEYVPELYRRFKLIQEVKLKTPSHPQPWGEGQVRGGVQISGTNY